MKKYNVIVEKSDLYFSLTGLQAAKGAIVEHELEDIYMLSSKDCVIVPELLKMKLAKKKKEDLQTPDELGESSNSDFLAVRLTTKTDFQSFAYKAISNIGLFFDETKYWWFWDTSSYRWKLADETTIFNAIDAKIQIKKNTVESKISNPLMAALRRQGRLNAPKKLSCEWIQFKEKLINFVTGEEMVASKEYWVTNPIPWSLGESEETPVLDKLLQDWIGKEKNFEVLKELYAFVLPTDYFISTVPFLYGTGGDGKSQFMKLMSKFVGSYNSASVSLEYLEHSQFGTFQLLNKLVCQVNEMPKNEIKKFAICKSISGRDEVPAEKKGCDQRKEILYSKIFMVGNDVPLVNDQSEGFFRRIALIPFPNKFKENGDIYLTVPDVEYRNLARWCLNRLKVLYSTRKLLVKTDYVDTKEEYIKESNQIIRFLKEENYVTTDDGSFILVTDLYHAFNLWATSNNKNMMDYKEFKSKLEIIGFVSQSINTYVNGLRTQRSMISGIKKEMIVDASLKEALKKDDGDTNGSN